MEERIVALFAAACEPVLASNPKLRERRREIKDRFLERNYLAIFTNRDLLEVYVSEYSVSRALCYHWLFSTSPAMVAALSSPNHPQPPLCIYAIGSGSGGEYVGLASALASLNSTREVLLHSQDIADYSHAMAPISATLASKFASVRLSFESSVFDILSSDPTVVASKQASVTKADIITAFFILNELLANSKSQFVAFVKLLVGSMKKGALLLVIDSAGSFSEVTIGPSVSFCMNLFIPHVINLGDAIQAFEIVEQSNSKWYRFPVGLQYPLKLNNIRHFLRIYRKL
ncbi:hypothetical protein BC830DRAFT_1072074 [Chytriomyces sp. MP71]|nr:hypothetical protein BC830DRAFT_1072074 [Chytriomyces sp. MP71]